MFDKSFPQSFYGIVPNRQAWTMVPKTGPGNPDTTGTSRTVYGRRHPAVEDDLIRANLQGADNVIIFTIFDDGTDPSFVQPQNLWMLVDPSGVKWVIKDVKVTILESAYRCVLDQGY